MPTDTSERGVELLIVRALTGLTDETILNWSHNIVAENPDGFAGAGYKLGRSKDYDRDNAVDITHLLEFLKTTQRKVFEQLNIENPGPARNEFLTRLRNEITKRGIVDVLRKGIKHGPASITLFYGAPSPGNQMAQDLWNANQFSITRQLEYNNDTKQSLDLCLFINGLPIATFELKNRLTKQTVDDAVQQYKRDRDPRNPLFHFKRCMVHFAVDDQQVMFCTNLDGKKSWFLPFNKGWNDGAGNPPNPYGMKTDYLWREVLTRDGLTDIIENYAQVVVTKDDKSGKVKEDLIFPRYHQRDVVRKLLEDAKSNGPGKRYLIQHSAGSGKSNSIAWLAHQLVGLEKDSTPIFDSVIVVTDRVILDRQIRDTIKQFAQVGNTVGAAERSGQLREFIASGKKVIITTLQKFPFILDDIGNLHRDSKFAILIDEAHSSQGGRTAGKMNQVLSSSPSDQDDEDEEDEVVRLMQSRKMLPNASYFAFTATPKNKTLEVFGVPVPQSDGSKKFRAFHSYTMKQAIQEGFILDVLCNYTPYSSYYNIVKTIESDPEFDKKKASNKLRKFVEGNPHAIQQKAKIMVDHFHDNVVALGKIDGKARAMVVTGSIIRALEYFHAFQEYLKERKSPYQAIVAFSGEHEFGGQKVTEATMNKFASNQIAEKIKEEPYRFLICADKFQTGYDEPLLHTMYVDKPLSGIKAVQTLSRLNRARPQKTETFVLDFFNDDEQLQKSFEPFYRTTILSRETDPNKLHDLKADLDAHQVYEEATVEKLFNLFINGADRDKLEPILERSVAIFINDLDEDKQVDFKGKAKGFVRTYSFLASILPYSIASWEKLSVFLNFLLPKLPAPKEDDLSRGILEVIDMDSYRLQSKSTMKIILKDEDGEVDPIPLATSGHKPNPIMEHLSAIIKDFNQIFGDIEWSDSDRVMKMVMEEIPLAVANNSTYQNAIKNSDKENARIEHDRVLKQVIMGTMKDNTELFKRFQDDPLFKSYMEQISFGMTYKPGSP